MDSLLKNLAPLLPHLQSGHKGAVRLFNGFFNNWPGLAVDLYGQTLLIHDLNREPNFALVQAVGEWYSHQLPWLQYGVAKTRHAKDRSQKLGITLFGNIQPDQSITENGVTYCIDLLMNQDAGFYLDTAGLRQWLVANSHKKRVLNTFAYTGSLGVAALAGGAEQVTQLDLNMQFLKFAHQACAANILPAEKMKLMAMDFFQGISHLKKNGEGYDVVILDPPFFSVTQAGRVDLNHNIDRLINKVRPLVRDGGKLIVINNALFVSGADFLNSLQSLTADGYLRIGDRIDVPQTFLGVGAGQVSNLPTDPSPFNHSTKIIILEITKKEP